MSFRVVLLLIFVLSSCTILCAQQETDVIKVESNIVVINAAITDVSGSFVSGLKRTQFSIFEDGVEQTIDHFSADETPFAAVILLDTSGSMENRISMARAAAIRFLSGLRLGDVAAIYRFDSKVEIIQDFSELRDPDERLFETQAKGMTAMNDAIIKASEILAKRSEKRKAIVVLSDGEDTISRRSSEFALKEALRIGASIYTVDMSGIDGNRRAQNAAVLRSFSENTGGMFIATPGGVAMHNAFERIVSELGNQYTLTYTPANMKKDGKWRPVELRVARKNLVIRTRKGYNAPKA